MSVSNERRIPEATVARLPEYLRLLTESFEAGVLNLSSDELSDMASTTLIHMLKGFATLVNGGRRVTPHILSGYWDQTISQMVYGGSEPSATMAA